MKRVDLEPTEPVIAECIRNDSIGRNVDLENFLKSLELIEGGYSIFIDGKWGTGKTIFVKQAKLLLDRFRSGVYENEDTANKISESSLKDLTIEKKFLTVYYNAWENDDLGDPIATLLAEIAYEYGVSTKEGLKVGPCVTALLDAALSPLSLGASGKIREGFTRDDYLKAYKERKEIRDKVKEAIHELLDGSKAEKMILFIDELDRCKPSFSVAALESVKYLFNDDRIIVVFSTDTEQLAEAIKGAYGSSYDGTRYLSRFYDMKVHLRAVEQGSYVALLGIERTTYRFDSIVRELARNNDFTMRDCNRFMGEIKKLREESLKISGEQNMLGSFCKSGLAPFLVFVKYSDAGAYNAVVNGLESPRLYELAKTSPSFIKFLALAKKGVSTVDDKDIQMDSDDLKNYLDQLCTFLFSEDMYSEEYREASELVHDTWGHPDMKRLLRFAQR